MRPLRERRNPVTAGIITFLASTEHGTLLAGQDHGLQAGTEAEADEARRALITTAPKRWVVYEPLALLPSGSFTSNRWRTFLAGLSSERRRALWATLLDAISKATGARLTHLAVNEGIPLHAESGRDAENVLRSPSGLNMLLGDFGGDSRTPGWSQLSDEAKFTAAFWVSTKQNGIYQTWAPRWTMFSRGNVKEKARLLDFHSAGSGSTRKRPRGRELPLAPAALRGMWAVDLYAGIGYFVFSYVRLGFRVLCWELNPWSVEGLRRGAEANRWAVRVVRGAELARPTAELVVDGAQIVVFEEDNAEARRRVRELRQSRRHGDLDVVHVNCGYLPSSVDTWRPARDIVAGRDGSWLHLHENVGVADIDRRRQGIEQTFDAWRIETADDVAGRIEHVELVKTYAPNVWHCVFDVYITKSDRDPSVSCISLHDTMP